jgi:myo-inositol-1(or 4)-monophosphatase
VGEAAAGRLLVSSPEELLDVAVAAACAAGTLLAERVAAGAEQDVASKSTPTDLVSEADLAAERAIGELLAERRPDDGILGEEGTSTQGTSGLEWVVDPLDGTVNFLFGIPQWSVSVAVRDRERRLAGAVYDVSRDELFTATCEGPALLRRGDGRALELASARAERAVARAAPAGGRDLAEAMVATGLSYDCHVRAEQARVLDLLLPRVRDIRRFGSAALDLCWTALGRCDAYYERTVNEWDIAAGALICERAGLSVLELPARELLPWGILAAPPELVEPLFELVGG